MFLSESILRSTSPDGTAAAKGDAMIPTQAPATPFGRSSLTVERCIHIPVESLPTGPREDGMIVTGYKTTAFNSLYGPDGAENVVWSDYFEKNNAVCG